MLKALGMRLALERSWKFCRIMCLDLPSARSRSYYTDHFPPVIWTVSHTNRKRKAAVWTKQMWVFVGLLLTSPEPFSFALPHPGQVHLDLWEARVAATLASTWDGGRAVKGWNPSRLSLWKAPWLKLPPPAGSLAIFVLFNWAGTLH